MKLKIKKNRSIFIMIAVSVVAAALGGGWYFYQKRPLVDARAYYACVEEKFKVASPSDASSGNIKDVSKEKPYTCKRDGKTYEFPSVFNESQIGYLDRVPIAVRPQIIALARENFKSCLSENFHKAIVPRVDVTLAQNNFVEIGVFCMSGYIEYLALDNGQWKDLGGGQMGLNCDVVDKYRVRKSSSINGGEPQGECYNIDHSLRAVPE